MRTPSKPRQFFLMGWHWTNVANGIELLNEERLLRAGRTRLLIDRGNPGFGHLTEAPRLQLTAYALKNLRDLAIVKGYWLVSERMKSILFERDPEAFDFALCELIDHNGTTGPARWLCDVMRVVDALDESASNVGIDHFENGEKRYNINRSPRRLVFQDDAVGPVHIFRMAHLEGQIVCDGILRNDCKSLKGIYFEHAVHPHATSPEKWIKYLRSCVDTLSIPPVQLRDAAHAKLVLAQTLIEYAVTQHGTESLEEAIKLLREVIDSGYRPSRPDLAKVHNDLGGALLTVYERSRVHTAVEDAIKAFREAKLLASTPSPGFRYEGCLLELAERQLGRAREGLKRAVSLR